MDRARLRFFLARLRRAGPAELIHRGSREIQDVLLRLGWLAPDGPRRVAEALPRFADVTLPGILGQAELSPQQAKREVLAAFESRWKDADPKRIPESDQGADIRSVWEPARLQSEMARLASGDTLAAGDVLHWVETHPFGKGPHFKSVMECALRIPVFLAAARVVDHEEASILLNAVYEHAWLIFRQLSLHSSLGNHTVTEAMGLVFAGAVFARDGEGRHWLQRGIELLEQECAHQILEDGGPIEQSLHYHRFVLDVYWYAVDFLEKNGLHDCAAMKQRLERGEEFWSALQVDEHTHPSLGDSDDGHVVAPGLHPLRQAAVPLPAHTGRTLWARTFPHAGYTVIRTPGGVVLTFDHGPLGMPPLHGHGHADALSVILYLNKTPFLIDPGTYRYNGVPEWREYFRSTRAHNTVCVDGLDQARQLGKFMWDKGFTTLWNIEQHEKGMSIKASHDGYTRLRAPVTHTRVLDVRQEGVVTMTDTFSGQGEHAFAMAFHLHPAVSVDAVEHGCALTNQDQTLTLTFQGGDGVEVLEGGSGSDIGWYSPHYGNKRHTRVVRVTKAGRCEDVEFRTRIQTG